MALNREQKRALKKQGELGDDGTPAPRKRSATPSSAARAKAAAGGKEERTTTRQFVKEVRGELRKVAWPTRSETLNYSLIVAVTLVIMTTLIFCLDWIFSEVILRLFSIQ